MLSISKGKRIPEQILMKANLAHINRIKAFSLIALLIVGLAVSSVGTGILRSGTTEAAVTTANLWVAPSGGSANCQRSATLIDYASSTAANAKCNSVAAATTAASSSVTDTVGIIAGNYGSLSMSGDSKAVNYIGAGDTTVFSGFTLGGTTAASKVENKTFQSFKSTGGGTFMNANHVNISNATLLDFSYIESSSYLNFDRVDFNGNGSTDDTIDFYEQDRSTQPNNNITISHSQIHGARASVSTSHPDGIQFCNCSGSRGDAYHAVAIKLEKNKFYDNECINLRTNPGTGLDVINNTFSDSVNGLSGCHYYTADVIGANGTMAYNTFLGEQKIQANSSFNATQTWQGNVGVGHSSDCGVLHGTWISNYWTDQKCSTSDKLKQVPTNSSGDPLEAVTTTLSLAADGTPLPGSPVIGAGGTSGYPAQDFFDHTRTSPTDAGAVQYGATSGGGGGGGSSATYHSADLTNLMSHYGQTSGQTTATGDLNGDGAVNIFDLGVMLADYSP